jgi:dTDP-4-amino-4,6-dideoxygalactose transaminase
MDPTDRFAEGIEKHTGLLPQKPKRLSLKNIPQTDPGASYRKHRLDIQKAVRRVLESGWYILGKEVEAFEVEFGAFLSSGPAVGVANGTDALTLALRGLGLKPGTGVITVSHTAAATVAAIELAGGVPVFTDIDPRWMVMEPQRLAETIREYRKSPNPPLQAVVVVHLYGQPADMAGIRAVCLKEGLMLVEDCAQSAGASWAGQMTGTWGDAASFSFYPTKNLGALGDGGAVVASNPRVAKRIRMLREYGWSKRNMCRFSGMNSRLDELQAAILRIKLSYLNQENEKRRYLASLYKQKIKAAGIELPEENKKGRHAYHLFVIRSEKRNRLKAYLRSQNIISNIQYPVPIHCQPGYRSCFWTPRYGLPETEKCAQQVLSLPLFPELSARNVQKVANNINSFKGKK